MESLKATKQRRKNTLIVFYSHMHLVCVNQEYMSTLCACNSSYTIFSCMGVSCAVANYI